MKQMKNHIFIELFTEHLNYPNYTLHIDEILEVPCNFLIVSGAITPSSSQPSEESVSTTSK